MALAFLFSKLSSYQKTKQNNIYKLYNKKKIKKMCREADPEESKSPKIAKKKDGNLFFSIFCCLKYNLLHLLRYFLNCFDFN